MDQLVAILSVGVVVFVSTNVDDILLLSAFFADPSFRPRQTSSGRSSGSPRWSS